MSHPSAHHDADADADEEQLELKPRPRPHPRRPFELEVASDPPTPTDTSPSSTFPDQPTRSFLNLTSSTLFGIYGHTTGTETIPPTPFGDGSQTPLERRSFDFTRSSSSTTKQSILPPNLFTKSPTGKVTRRRDTNSHPHLPPLRRKTFKNFYIPLFTRLTTLFLVGTFYGSLISHLHDRQKLAPTHVALDRERWSYYIVWGLIGMALGEALPWADMLWAEDEDGSVVNDEQGRGKKRKRRESWLDAVRSIGLFVGIAFAIRKLPWQSTLQLSLTLALANPAIWYLVDRSPPGFLLSTAVSLGGTVAMLGINPALLPPPTPREVLRVVTAGKNGTLAGGDGLVWGVFRSESVGVATWIASVFFVSAVCLGNVGRRLAARGTPV